VTTNRYRTRRETLKKQSGPQTPEAMR
jgi:hypothetical protein